MATIDWPEALIPQTCAIGSQGAGVQFKSPYNGTLQAIDFVAERLVLSATLPQRRRAGAGAVEAFLFQLRGGVNRVRAWHFGRPVPVGTLRGTPTLKTTVTRGASSIVLQGCTGANLISGGGFDIAGVGGLGAGWSSYQSGSTGSVVYDLFPRGAGNMQRAFAGALAVAGRVGVSKAGAPAAAGQTYTLAADLATGSVGLQIVLNIDWSAGGAYVSSSNLVHVPVANNDFRRVALTATAPATADGATLYVWMTGGSGAPASLLVDTLQWSIGTSSEPVPTTLLAGDLLGMGNHLMMARASATANDAGEMTVPIVHRIRETVASGVAVTWDKPTAQFVMPSQLATVMHFPGGIESAALDLEEVW
jgi:hypothetical protein